VPAVNSGSGLVGGEGLLGVAIAGAAFYYKEAPAGLGSEWASRMAEWLGAPDGLAAAAPSLFALAAFAALAAVFARYCRSREESAALS